MANNGDAVTKADLEKLSKNFFDRVRIIDHHDGKLRPISCDDPKDNKKNDTKSVYFDKAKIDALFTENPGSNGLKIYFGIHDSKIFPNEQPENYDGKIMVVLVSTTDKVDNLKDNQANNAVGYEGGGGGGGNGVDAGQLCPPNVNC